MRLIRPIAATTLALALTACSSAGGGPGPTAPQEQESSATAPASSSSAAAEAEAPSSSPEETSSTPTDTGKPFDPEEFTGRLEAAVQENPTVRIDVQVQLDEQLSATAEGVQDLERNALDMDVTLGAQELGYRLVDGRYYLAQPPKWVPVTKDSDNPLIQSTLQQIQILSMRNQLDAFIAGVEAAGIKGEEEVGGVLTTHYTATVDAAKSLSALDMARDPATPESVIYDVWLDEEDLIRKMSFTQNGATATMTATDWGEPVTIEKPTKAQLAQAPESGTP